MAAEVADQLEDELDEEGELEIEDPVEVQMDESSVHVDDGKKNDENEQKGCAEQDKEIASVEIDNNDLASLISEKQSGKVEQEKPDVKVPEEKQEQAAEEAPKEQQQPESKPKMTMAKFLGLKRKKI